MDKIASLKKTKEIIEEYKFKFTKSLGQNFLVDTNILEKIVEGAQINKTDYVLEIGPGIGSLTQHIADKAKKVVAVEIDKNLLPILQNTLRDYKNIEIVHGDILKLNLHQLIQEKLEGKKIKVVANLPYYITTPIIMKFLEEKIPVLSMTVMIQQEVAQRIQAKPSTKDYGALSIGVQYYCEAKILLKVPPSVFIPQPKVDSTVLRLDILEKPRVQVKNEEIFFKIVKDAFGKRRKTLLNALSSGTLKLDKELLKESFKTAEIDGERRGETLSLQEFAALANAIVEKL